MFNIKMLKPLFFMVFFLLLIQLLVPYFIPPNILYRNRLNYDLVKNRPTNIDAVLEQVKITIDREKLQKYVVILGDSVAFSNPGPADQSITVGLSQLAQKNGSILPVFNLAMPAMQIGDMYTMLLKMQQHGISSEYLIANITYAGFVRRNPEPPVVYWLQSQLQQLDRSAYQRIAPSLPEEYKVYKAESTVFSRFTQDCQTRLYEKIKLFTYKDTLQIYFTQQFAQLSGQAPPSQTETQITQPWYTKGFLWDLLQEPVYQRDFSPEAFIMTDDNPQIYFLNKIIEQQAGKKTLVFLAALNDTLLAENVNDPRYQDNLTLINAYFMDKPVDFLNLYGRLDSKLFSDHIHLTGEGYAELSELLYPQIRTWW